MKGFVIYPTYKIIDSKAYVCLYGRLENGDSFLSINYFKPYFYIKKEDLELAEELGEFESEETDFKNFKDKNVVRIIMNLPFDVPKLRKKFEDNQIECYEADIRFAYRFMMDKGIQGSLDIEGNYVAGDRIDRIYKDPEIKSAEYKPKNLRVLSFDIESSRGTEEDQLYCIGLVCGNVKKVFINSEEKIDGAISCKNEEEVIEKFINEVITLDPDVITGWNVIDFDLNYLNKKCKKHKIEFDFGREPGQCKLKIEESFFKESKVDVPGRQVLDGLNLLRVSFIKVEDYKLDTVAHKILGERKLIQTQGVEKYKEIDELFKNNKKKLVEYNLKDAELVVKILEKTKVFELSVLRSLLTGMPLDRVDASIASFDSLYIRECIKRKLVVPTGNYIVKEERIKGGYVRESLPGIYNYILILDFKSLYPSIIRTFNIDPYSYVSDCKGKNLIKAPNGACFRNEEGILPEMLQKLYHEREIAIKEKDDLTKHAIKILSNSFFGLLAHPSCRFFDINMTNAITYFGQHIIKLTSENIENLGYKVIYNDSISGKTELILVDNNKNIIFMPIEKLFKNVDYVNFEKEYYIPKYFQVLSLDKNGCSVFKPIKYVMRHKTKKKMYRIWLTNYNYIETTEDHSLIGYINKCKKLNLKVTDRLIKIKPSDIGSKVNSLVVLKKIPSYSLDKAIYPKEFYEFMGYFIGDGSFLRNSIHKKYNKDYYLRISSGIDKKEFFDKVINPLKTKNFVKSCWESKTRKGDLTVNGLKLIKLICSMVRVKNQEKSIPKFIFNQREEDICSFLRGLFSADGTVMIRSGRPIVRFTNIDESIIEDTRRLLFLVGISNSCFKENNPNKYKDKISKTYSKHVVIKDIIRFREKIGFLLNRKQNRLECIRNHPSKKTYYKFDFDLSKVQKIEEIETPKYVYDIEVDETHRFFANKVLVHNTDSNFVVSNANNLEEADKIGKNIQNHINKFYKDLVKKEYNRESFLELSYDKCFVKCLMPKLRKADIGAKKRYAGLVIKDGKEEIQFTGLETKRSDWTQLAKKYQQELLDRIFHDKDVVDFTKKFVDDIKNGKYDELLIYKKNIRKELKMYTKSTPPHVKAARKLEILESNKIEYIMTEDGPEPLQNLKHKIDYEHYIDKQIKPIADSVLVFFNKNFDDLIKGSQQLGLGNF